jgi:predicted nuclease of predicted toxin-antitoxin system
VRVLLDQGTPAPLRRLLADHEVATAHERGWATMKNGDLLAAAEAAGFEIFVTTDKNLQYQQNLETRVIAIVVLSTTSWPRIQAAAGAVVLAIGAVASGSFTEVSIP